VTFEHCPLGIVLLAIALFSAPGCKEREGTLPAHSDAGLVLPEPSASATPEQRALQVLYLPDGGDQVIGNAPFGLPPAPVVVPSVAQNLSRRCPPEMVDVKGQFCIDRWEVSLVDAASGRMLSPYYSPEPRKAKAAHDQWERERMNVGSAHARATELPELADWQTSGRVEPMATSKPGRVPNGYLDGNTAARACDRAGKRLCTTEEWTTACRGETNRQFPYGERYEHGVCNVFRDTHPAAVLHDDASMGHMDPRLNQVETPAGPLLQRTGSTSRCASHWGNDAIFDMVGNLDEWVDDGPGAFMGGFYARSTRLGCDARISTHPKAYADYSLGVRCCK
jgi:formylglycine-generating enzyme required for sulfatase activity